MASNDEQVTNDLIETLAAGRDELNSAAAKFEEDGREELASTLRVLAAQRERYVRRLRGLASRAGPIELHDDAQPEASDRAEADLSAYLRTVVERQALDIRAARDHLIALHVADDRSDRPVTSHPEEGNDSP